MILTVTLNPCIDVAYFVDTFQPNDANRVKEMFKDAGGKGVNVARVAAELGAETMCTGFLGGGAGAFIQRVLDDQGARHSFCPIEGETRVNFSIEDSTGKPPTTLNERGPTISSEDFERFLTHADPLVAAAKWVAIGGSIPPGLDPSVYRRLVTMGHELDAKVVLDADGDALRLGLEAKPDLTKPNASEASRLLGWEVKSPEDAQKAARAMLPLLAPGGAAIVSMGEAGAAMACAEGEWFVASPQVETKSTIGAGDSLIGAYLWALSVSLSPLTALRWGIAAGAATATTTGNEIGRKPVIERLYEQIAK